MLPTNHNNQRDLVPPTPRLTVSRGGLYRSSEARAVTDLESCFREAAAASKRSNNSKAYPGPMIAGWAVAITIACARRIAAAIEQNWKGGGSREFGERLGHGILTYNAQMERKYGRPAASHSEDQGAA
jgi:hypothetical protein